MIEKMEKIYVYSLAEQSTSILADMMKCGVVETTQAETMLEDETMEKLTTSHTVDLSREEELLERLEISIGALKPFAKKKSLFDKRPRVTYSELVDPQVLEETMKLCEKVGEVAKVRGDYEKELKRQEYLSAGLIPWESLDVDVSDFKTNSTTTLCYVLANPRTLEEIEEAVEEKEAQVWLRQVFADKENSYFMALAHNDNIQEIREIISMFGVKEFSLDQYQGKIKDNMKQCQENIKALTEKIKAQDEKLAVLVNRKQELELAYDAVTVGMDCLRNREKLAHTKTIDIITGWIPEKQKELLNEKLTSYTCYCEYKVPEKQEEYPVLMKNSKLVEPFGAITEMYSLPNSRSMDSNWAIGLFFFIFFGMMLSDLGYGLLLTIGGLVGAKLLDLNPGGKRFLKMLGMCGISTMVFGFIYGSFFGDVVPKVAEVFFGKSIVITPIIDPLKEPMTVLALACALGVVHLFIGMGFKAYMLIKRGHKWGALFDVGFWYIFLIGLPLMILPGTVRTIGIAMSIGGALGLVLTQGRDKPTLFGKITSGIMSLYDVTGYFSDVLSYSRILALGLATGVIAGVVNTIGSLSGGSIIGAILFVVIFVGGHALNLAINALGAYVHAARLQYVEFFGKYYESGGQKFDPLTPKTKYVNITEEK
ncbi:MAG: V-type ATP synthase subunit I [Anaerovoracaceae bacterium]